MNKINVKIKRLSSNAVTPEYATANSSACDLSAAIDGALTIEPHKILMIPTGISIECEQEGGSDVTILIFARSGLASKHGISLANGVGVVDSDYRGEIKVPLINNSDVPFTIENGDRIAQMMFLPVLKAEFHPADELNSTERGAGGFGSTGL